MATPAHYELIDLINIEQTRELLQRFLDAGGIPAAIIDLRGTVLVTSRWQRVCTDFHRKNEITRSNCIESDTRLANELQEGKPFSIYRCPNGLTDAASPIIIEGRHLANAFIGQFFVEKPDLEFFRQQAAMYGFDESKYLEAVAETPIVDQHTLPAILSFLTSFAGIVASLGLKQIRQLETQKELREAKQRLEIQNRRLQQREEDLNRAQSVARIGSWRMDVRRNVLHWSNETYRLFGVPKGNPMTYEAFIAMIHPGDRELVDRVWQAALSGKPYDVEHRIVVGDLIRWVHEQAELEFDEQDELLGGFGTVQDITERKRMEEELRESHDQMEQRVRERTNELAAAVSRLESMNKELQEFAYVASHDLQEPLRKIQAFADRLKSRCGGKLDETETDYLARMERAASRMQQLISDLLSLSRVGSRPGPIEPLDLNAIAREVAETFEHRIIQKGGKLQIEDLPTIEADETQMRQLFQNLIANALKFQKNGGKPQVRVYSDFPGMKTCRICVEDNGIGFDEIYLDRIFIPFQRLHGRDEFEGTGMGLAICRKIVERHGGNITARSQPGHGSTFLVTLPLKANCPEAKILN